MICITGNGYKTVEVMTGRGVEPVRIGRSLKDFEAIAVYLASPATKFHTGDVVRLDGGCAIY